MTLLLIGTLFVGGAGIWPSQAVAAPSVPDVIVQENSPSLLPSEDPMQPSAETIPSEPPATATASPTGAEASVVNGYPKPEGAGSAMGSAGKAATGDITGESGAQSFAGPLEQTSRSLSTRAIQPDGTAGMPLGLDVSGWQPTVDWTAAWNNGARFAYIKASEGPWTMNNYFAQQYSGSAAVGMIRGAYHFASPHISSGINQAHVFVQSGGGWSPDGKTLPGVLDLEIHVPVNANDRVGSCYDLTPSQLVAWTKDFTTTYRNLTGRDAVIYTSHSFWGSCMGGTTAFSAINPLWVAAYGPPLSGVRMFGGWLAFTFWQYADAGTFPGDQNVFNGSYDRLKIFATGVELPVEVVTKNVIAGKDLNGDGIPDVVSTKSDGTLWFYPGARTGSIGAGRKIGSGWDIFDLVIGVGDFNKDGKNDLMARKTDGSLWFYAGTGVINNNSEGYLGGVKIGMSGWDSFSQILGIGDYNKDGNADLLATGPDGVLWFYPGNGAGRTDFGRRIGTGWDIYDLLIAPGDFDLDGTVDIIARNRDGSLWHYAGTGLVGGSNEGYAGATKIGDFGWNSFGQILGAGDVNGDGKNDLLARSLDSSLLFYQGTAMKDYGFQAATKIGLFGWESFNNVAAGKDFNGDGIPDVISTKLDGTLWFYPGTRTGSLGAGRKIGSGWNIYDLVVGVGDFNKDGKNDLMARKPDGSLWFYAGTGIVNNASEGYIGGVQVGQFGWGIFSQILGVGDFDKDGNSDLLATGSDGTLWFYPGNASGRPGAGRKIGTGWNIYDQLVAPGDFDLDGKADIIARKRDGSLWHYAGTGVVNGSSEGYIGAAKIGDSGWDSFNLILGAGDANGDGRKDLLARGLDGSLWFHLGTVGSNNGYRGAVKVGAL